MKTPTPFDLNEAIRRWQQDLGASPAFCADNLEELVSHLRASVQKLKASGLSEEEAFRVATQRIGERGRLEREFAKVNPSATRSLPVILFWVVAGMYLFQVVFSLVGWILVLRQRLEIREFQRLIALRPPVYQIYYQAFNSHYHPPRSFTPMLSIVVVLVYILGGRLATGSWKRFGATIKIFERPVRTSLNLVLLGLVVTFLPGFFLSEPGPTMAGYLVAWDAVNVVLVLSMVLLARRRLRVDKKEAWSGCGPMV
jgi:hypothetical protein